MAEPSTHNNYTFEDIQHYLQGKMSAAEMHEIEKAALQDPFLADAIEGYYEVPSMIAQQHLNEINAALLSEKKKSAVISINKKFQWLRVAVVIIILAGVGVIGTYVFKSSNKQQQVAQIKKEKNNKTITQDTVAAITPETFSADKNIVAQNKTQRKILSVKKESQSNVYADTIAKDETATSSVMAAPSAGNNEVSKSIAPVLLSNKKNNDSLQKKISGINTFTGKVVDENDKPVPGAFIETTDKKNGTVSDLNGDFVLRKNDSMLTVTTTTVGYENKNVLLKSNDTTEIRLRQNSSALNDVVVIGYGIRKNKSAKETAMPVGGWNNFNSYVISKLNKDSTGRENYISNNDIVELEFLIDDEGNPYNITITKPSDNEKNLKAIDILKSGPKWTNTSKKKKAKVAIAF